MSANDKFGLCYGDYRYDGILSYENKVLQSVFMNKDSDLENQPLYDKFVTAEVMHAVPPPMTGNYMPSGPDVEIDYSQFTYGPKQSQPSESETQTSDFDTCESKSSVQTHEYLSEPTVIEPKVVDQPKVWYDAPIIEEYESDSEDEHVSQPTKEHEQPSFASNNKQVKTPKETVQNKFTHGKYPRVDKKRLGYGFTARACFVCGSFSHLIRDCDFHEKRMAKQAELNNSMRKKSSQREIRPIWKNVQRVNHKNQFIPTAVLTRTGKIPVNTARASGTNKVSTARHDFNRQAVLTSAAMKVNTVTPIVNRDYPHRALKHKGIVDSGCSRHMTGNKAYLAEYQDFNGGPVAFGGSKGYITGKGKIKTGKLDFEDVCFVKELQQFNLFSVSQICDKKNKVLFTDSECLVLSPEFKLPDENQVLLRIPRQNNMYSFNLENIVPSGGLACLIAKATIDESNKWHRRLGHVNFKNLNKLVKGNLVRGLPSKIFQNDHTCVACQKGKQHKASCKAKSVSSISHSLQLLHMDLFGPTSVRSLNHKTYCLVITDDFSRCDNGTEFKNKDFIELYGSKGIKREYSNAKTPQQNRVADRKNRTLIEAARTILEDSFLPNTFWAEAVSTACYVLNRVLVTKPHNKTPYELVTGKIPIISYIRPSGCHVTMLNTIDHLGKFDGKSDEGFLVGYSLQSKAFREKDQLGCTQDNIDAGDFEKEDESDQDYFVLPIWSSYSSTVKRSTAMDAGEASNKHPDLKTDEKPVDEEDQVFLDELERLKRQEKDANDAAEVLRKEFAQETENLLIQAGATKASSTNIVNTVSTPVSTVSPYGELSFTALTNPKQDDLEIPALEDIYEHPTDGILTNSSYDDEGVVADFTNLETIVNVSHIPTSRIHSIHPSTLILGDPQSAVQTRSKVTKSSGAHAFVDAMQEELLQFKIQKVWILVDLPYKKKAIGTKWVYRNKKIEKGVVVRNKARLVAQGHMQEEEIDYDHVFAPVGLNGHLDAKKKFVMYPRFISIFLGKQLVNVQVPLDHFPINALTSKVFSFMVKKGKHFSGKVAPLFASILVQSTKDEGATSERPSESQPTPSPPHPSEANIKPQSDPSVRPSPTPHIPDSILEVSSFISQNRYVAEILKKFDFVSVKTLVKDEEASDVDVHLYRSMIGSLMYLTASRSDIMFAVCAGSKVVQGYSQRLPILSAVKRILDSDYAGANLDRKSTTGDYVADSNCCGQVMWIQNQMLDYGFNFMNTKIYIDNESTICIVKNPVYHSKTKHIAIRHHFIRDAYEKKLIQVLKFHTDDNVADLLTKAFDVSRGDKKEEGTDISKDSTDKEEEDTDKDKDSTISLDEGTDDQTEARNKGKKKIEEEDESDTESEDILEAEKKFKQLAKDEKMARNSKMILLQNKRAHLQIRNKPPTRTQFRNQMMTYLKHVGNKKYSDLKNKTFEEIQALYEKVKRFDESFTAVGSTEDVKRIKEMNEGVKDSDQKRLKEEEQANGNFRAFNYLMEVLHIFDREYLYHLYNLMMEQYSEITLEGIELILWGDLKIMMESSTEENDQSDFWSNQQDWKIVTWRLYEACGVCILEFE
ncbi:putative ribonuclease H-like domain-containing protein [Tanacetum coccineum]